MNALILDPYEQSRLIQQRRVTGADRYDEVWEGVYVVSPMPNNEHQLLASRLSSVLGAVLDFGGMGSVYCGVNVSDREEQWTQNYRCPDVACYATSTSARDCGTHWLGGPDFGVEIISPHDQTRDKLEFYGQVGTRELLIVDSDPWRLELYRLKDSMLELAGVSSLEDSQTLASEVMPLSFQLLAGESRPRIRVRHSDGRQEWMI